MELNCPYPDPKPGDGVHHPNFVPPLTDLLTEPGVECQALYHDDYPSLSSPEFNELVMRTLL